MQAEIGYLLDRQYSDLELARRCWTDALTAWMDTAARAVC
jgi:hypothetical protein